MRLIDEQYTRCPFYGSRRITQWLVRRGHEVNRKRVEYIRSQQVRQAEQASEVTLAAYRLGGVPLMDYLDAQRRYRDTMRVYNQALYDERTSRFALAAAIGKGETQ